VVDVLVGENHQLDLLELVAEGVQPALELVERGAGVRPRVHERQRVVVDQVHVHPADGERGWDGEAVDAGHRGDGVEVVAHAGDPTRVSYG